ncbi:MAG TPA: hypothetical protein VKU02_12900 [Gemmataceae bacterium]|nr:hypothetical protein [Gemmataceae bacterium]
MAVALTYGVVAAAPQVPEERLAFPRVENGLGYAVEFTNRGQPRSTDLARQYVAAEKQEDKRDIRKKLSDALSQQFDAHIKQQQKELEDLEKQIANLRSVLQKRIGAKSTIVERRVEQLIQDAEGLGWNAPGGLRHGYDAGTVHPLTVPVDANRFPKVP